MTLSRFMGIVVVACMLWPAAASADEAGSVVVLPFSGPRSDQAHERVEWVLRVAGYRLFDEAGAPAFNASESDFAAFAKRWRVSAFIMGEVRSQRNNWSLELQVRSGHDGKPIDNARLAAPWMPGLLRSVETDLMRTINPMLAQTSQPEGDVEEVSLDGPAKGAVVVKKTAGGEVSTESKPKKKSKKASQDDEGFDDEEADEEASEDDEEAVADEPARPRRPRGNDEPPSLSLGINGGYLFRNLNATAEDNPEGELTESSGAFPALTVQAGVYPVAFFESDNFWTNVGVEGEFETSLGGSESFTVQNAVEPVNVNTSMTGWMVGPRVRFPFKLDLAEVGVSVKYGNQKMALEFDEGDGIAAAPRALDPSGVGGAPDVNYQFFRFGVDGRYRFTGFIALNGAVAYRLVTNPGDNPGEIAGDVTDGEPGFFPEDNANGVDGAVSVDFKLVDNLELRVGGDARYYAHEFNPTQQVEDSPGERRPIAAGATDGYYRGTVGVVWTPNL